MLDQKIVHSHFCSCWEAAVAFVSSGQTSLVQNIPSYTGRESYKTYWALQREARGTRRKAERRGIASY